jgi:osmotically-inducible protein OsmY
MSYIVYRKWSSLMAVTIVGSTLAGCGIPLVLGAAATAGYVGLQTRPSGQVAADTDTKVRIKSYLTQTKYQYLADIGIDVFYGDVLVTGIVPTTADGEQVITLIKRTQGVRKVYNELFVGGAYTAAQKAKDAWITTQLQPRLIGTKGVYPLNYLISVANNHVYVMGTVASADERSNVLHLARTTPGVQQVHDYLLLASETPEGRPNLVDQGNLNTSTERRPPNPLPADLFK